MLLSQQLASTSISSAGQLGVGLFFMSLPQFWDLAGWRWCRSCGCWSQSMSPVCICPNVLPWNCPPPLAPVCHLFPHMPGSCGEGVISTCNFMPGSCGEGVILTCRLQLSTPKSLILCMLTSWRSSCYVLSTARSSFLAEKGSDLNLDQISTNLCSLIGTVPGTSVSYT